MSLRVRHADAVDERERHHQHAGRLRQIELIAGAGSPARRRSLLAGVVRAALRPLDRMSELARRIRERRPGARRLRPTKRGTDLGRTAAAFDDMLDALESAEAQARSAEGQMRQFLADASHDLRTPLAGVIAGAEQLLRSPAGAGRPGGPAGPGGRGRRAERLGWSTTCC